MILTCIKYLYILIFLFTFTVFYIESSIIIMYWNLTKYQKLIKNIVLVYIRYLNIDRLFYNFSNNHETITTVTINIIYKIVEHNTVNSCILYSMQTYNFKLIK